MLYTWNIPSGDEIFICAGDGNSDFVGFFNTSNSGNNYRYLVTDEDGVLLDVIGFNLYNFENSGAGVCRIYGLDLTGVLNVFVGDNIFEDGKWFTAPDYSGYALGYGLETFVGPIELKYTWSPETKKSIWFFNLGFWF